MSLRILNVAYPFAPASLSAVGGAEQILALIDEALARSGLQSFVLGCRGSRARGQVIEAFEPPARIADGDRSYFYSSYRQSIETLVREQRIDLVHYHGVDFHEYLPNLNVPQLATLHLPPEWYPPAIFELPNVWLHCVSEAQHKRCPKSPRLLAPIPNGVRLPVRAGVRKRGYAAALGRICPEKGYALALDSARHANAACLLAGQVFPYEAHQDYFRSEILPRLDRHRRFIGPLGPVAKARLLAGANCLLIPSLVAETSSLVAMEAMLAGTPVIAFPSGALPSLVVDGVTGFIVNDSKEMARAISTADTLSPENCRAYAREHFSADRMTGRYLQLYAQLVNRAHLPAAA